MVSIAASFGTARGTAERESSRIGSLLLERKKSNDFFRTFSRTTSVELPEWVVLRSKVIITKYACGPVQDRLVASGQILVIAFAPWSRHSI